jgi:hypothetical protein
MSSLEEKTTASVLSIVIIALLAASAVRPLAANSASPSSNTIPAVGLDENYPVPQSFINTLASDGMAWIRQYGPSANTAEIHDAGVNILMVLNENLFTWNFTTMAWQPPPYEYSNVNQLTTSQWYSLVYETAKAFPYITEWEFLNEPNLAGGGSEPTAWTPQEYFPYLVATYLALKAANPANTLVGPTLAWPWPMDSYDFQNGIISWLTQLWALKDTTTGLTASDILSQVSMHIYTSGYMGNVMIDDNATLSGFPSETQGQLIQSYLSQVYAVTGKPMVIDEFGWPTNGSSVYTPAMQATYYQQFMTMMESTPHVAGVYAFNWSDYDQGGGLDFGLFDSSLNPQPAWSVYHEYFPSTTSTSTTTSATSTTDTSTPTSTTTTSTSTSTSMSHTTSSSTTTSTSTTSTSTTSTSTTSTSTTSTSTTSTSTSTTSHTTTATTTKTTTATTTAPSTTTTTTSTSASKTSATTTETSTQTVVTTTTTTTTTLSSQSLTTTTTTTSTSNQTTETSNTQTSPPTTTTTIASTPSATASTTSTSTISTSATSTGSAISSSTSSTNDSTSSESTLPGTGYTSYGNFNGSSSSSTSMTTTYLSADPTQAVSSSAGQTSNHDAYSSFTALVLTPSNAPLFLGLAALPGLVVVLRRVHHRSPG